MELWNIDQSQPSVKQVVGKMRNSVNSADFSPMKSAYDGLKENSIFSNTTAKIDRTESVEPIISSSKSTNQTSVKVSSADNSISK